ncbi:MAG: peroxiredoxin-like family protein [Hyphomicrobiaceae bacterium]|nr:peroxiredoxin-like family protein [Hyphomicrobiaceae bacterium]
MTQMPPDPVTPLTESEAFEAARALARPLGEQLARYAAWHCQLEPAEAEAYQALVDRVSAFDWSSAAPTVGTALSEFLLPDSTGRLVGLRTLMSKGPVVVSFNRGHWCNFCRLELAALGQAAATIADRGARIVSITPERAPFANALKRDLDLPFPVLCDVDLGYALENGLVMPLGMRLREMFLQCGLDLEVFQGHAGWFVPVPATFVLRPDGKITAAFVDPDFRHRMPIEDILDALEHTT